MKKKIGYIRTSTTEQTPELQIQDILSIVQLSECDIFKEKQSAWKENTVRPEFNKIISLIKQNKVESLYVWSLDRIYRNRKRLVEFLRFCKVYKTNVFSYNQKWLDNLQQMDAPFNEIMYDFMLQILGWIAEDESTLKSNRVKMAIVRDETGTKSYRGNKWGRKALSKQTINRVMELHNEGKSIREIAKSVFIYDKNNNSRNISKSAVHKLLCQKLPLKKP